MEHDIDDFFDKQYVKNATCRKTLDAITEDEIDITKTPDLRKCFFFRRNKTTFI